MTTQRLTLKLILRSFKWLYKRVTRFVLHEAQMKKKVRRVKKLS